MPVNGLELTLGFNPRPRANSGATDTAYSAAYSADQFQSAPQSELWGDAIRQGMSNRRALFQSAPQSELWGDQAPCLADCFGLEFQSAPQSELWGDSLC